jgi:hypothetical protein
MEQPTAIPEWLPENHKWSKLSTKESRDAALQSSPGAGQAEPESDPPIAPLHTLLGDAVDDSSGAIELRLGEVD